MMTHAAWLLLIPAAAAAGWLAGRRGGEIKGGARVSRLSNTYFRGLNYLLNEQQDKAIEIFLQIAEVDKDTVETQFALGHLFRRRGEVDRAIRLHQNLVARIGLSEEQKTRAVLALGEDYMRAGLLDRAETLFTDLVKMGVHAPQALRQLIAIYQFERDWYKAIDHALEYEKTSGEPMGRVIAHFHCELAEKARLENRIELASLPRATTPPPSVPSNAWRAMTSSSFRRSSVRCWPATNVAARRRAPAASCRR